MDPRVDKCYFNLNEFTQENVDALYKAAKINRWQLYREPGVESLSGNILLNTGERKRFSSIKRLIGEDFQLDKCGKLNKFIEDQNKIASAASAVAVVQEKQKTSAVATGSFKFDGIFQGRRSCFL